ncbi:integrase [Kitasatospora sp. NPDC058478]
MTRMGHSSTRAALIYQRMTSDRDWAIAGRMGEALGQQGASGTRVAQEE